MRNPVRLLLEVGDGGSGQVGFKVWGLGFRVEDV